MASIEPGSPAAIKLIECAQSDEYKNYKGEVAWSLIIRTYPRYYRGMSIQKISQKFNRVLNPNLIKGPFTDAEIELVKRGMELYDNSPSKISKYMFDGTRSDVQLHPYIKKFRDGVEVTKKKKKTNGVKKQQKMKKTKTQQKKKKKTTTKTRGRPRTNKKHKREAPVITVEEDEEEEEAPMEEETDEEDEEEFEQNFYGQSIHLDSDVEETKESLNDSPPSELVASKIQQVQPTAPSKEEPPVAPPSSSAARKTAPEPSMPTIKKASPSSSSPSLMSPPKSQPLPTSPKQQTIEKARVGTTAAAATTAPSTSTIHQSPPLPPPSSSQQQQPLVSAKKQEPAIAMLKEETIKRVVELQLDQEFNTQTYLYGSTLSPIIGKSQQTSKRQPSSSPLLSSSSPINFSEMKSYFVGEMKRVDKVKQVTINNSPLPSVASSPSATSSSSSLSCWNDMLMESPPSQGLHCHLDMMTYEL